MSSFMKKIFLCLIGILAGLASWPIAEVLINNQTFFQSYLIFSVCFGMVFGIIMGAFFSVTESITTQNYSQIISSILIGIIIGAIGGILGFLTAQFILFFIGEKLLQTSTKNFNTFILPLSRATGWAVLGIFIGMIEGIRSQSGKKIIIGLIGGLLGGVFGGLALEYITMLIPNLLFSRLIGLVIFGFFIGLFYGFIEKSLSAGILRVLNGAFKGKEYLINQRRLKIGKAKNNDIILKDFSIMDDNHALINVKKDKVMVKNLSKTSPVRVNDEVVNEKELKFEDVIKIGTAKFLFKYR